METLLAEQSTADDKMIVPSLCLLLSRSVGGRSRVAVRSLSGNTHR
jgi:hypothetical protein